MTIRYARIGDQPELDRPLADGDLFEAQTPAGQSVHVTGAQLMELAGAWGTPDGRDLLTATRAEQRVLLGVNAALPPMPTIGEILMTAENGVVETGSLYPYILNKLAADIALAMEQSHV